MTDENNIKAADTPFEKKDTEQPLPPVQDAEPLQPKIAGRLTQVDQASGQLLENAKIKDVREDLILQLRQANENLVKATFNAQDLQAKAEAANHRQDEFLSMLAHELRNPLAPVAMAAELLGRITNAHPELPMLHRIIDRQLNHMTRLVDDLVDAARVSSGKFMLQKRPLLLSEIIGGAIETHRPFMETRHQTLAIDLPAEDIVIDGDLVRLVQVFSNLLINATKFTPEHEHISISARKRASTVTVSVKDNGMGITEDIQPFIFDLFKQGFRTLDRSQGGLGIGLSLVRTIVEMHGGTVSVSSAGTGFGSEFSVVLPTSPNLPQRDFKPPSKTVTARPCRILLIEDNVDANQTLNKLLVLEGHTIVSAFDGTTGLAMAKEKNYDVIICDIGLPGMDGFEIVKQLRRDALKPLPCIIGLTGYSQLEYRARAIEAGFDHYLVKPVAIDILANLIASHLPR